MKGQKKPTPYQVRTGMQFKMQTPKFLQDMKQNLDIKSDKELLKEKFHSTDIDEYGKDIPPDMDDKPTVVEITTIKDKKSSQRAERKKPLIFKERKPYTKNKEVVVKKNKSMLSFGDEI